MITCEGIGILNSPFYLAVAKGDVPGHSIMSKFGQNSALNASTYEHIWDGGGVYSYPADGSALIVDVVSSSASDTTDIEIQGLDVNGDLTVLTETLTGTTPVTIGTALWRIFRMKNVGAVDYVGEITLTNAAGTVDYAVIQIGNGQTLMALYTIPNATKGYMLKGTNNLSGVTRAVAASGRLLMRPFGGVDQLKKTFGVNSEGSSFLEMAFPLPAQIPGKTDIKVEAIGSTAGVSLNTTFDILLVEDGY